MYNEIEGRRHKTGLLLKINKPDSIFQALFKLVFIIIVPLHHSNGMSKDIHRKKNNN